MLSIIKSQIRSGVSIVERLINDGITSRISVEDICEGIIQTDSKYEEVALSLLAVAVRNSDRKESLSVLRYFNTINNRIAPEIYLDLSSYSPKNRDIPAIYRLNANKLLAKALSVGLISNEESLFRHLGDTLNLDGIKIAINAGKKPSYSVFDAIIETLAITDRIIKDKEVLDVSHKLASGIIELLTLHGYEADNRQKQKMSLDIINNISNIQKSPQWVRECKVTKGNTSPRLRALANDIGIDSKATKEVICSTITEYAKLSLEDIIKEGQESMSTSLEPKLFRVLPPDRDIKDIKLPNSSLYGLKRRAPYQYSPSGIIKYKEWYFVEEEFPSIIKLGVNPYTGEPLPGDIIHKMKLRVNQVSYKGTIKSVAKRVSRSDEDAEEKYQIKLEAKFYAILEDYELDYVKKHIRSMMPPDIKDMALYTLNVKGIITLRSYINEFFNTKNREEVLDKISLFFSR